MIRTATARARPLIADGLAVVSIRTDVFVGQSWRIYGCDTAIDEIAVAGPVNAFAVFHQVVSGPRAPAAIGTIGNPRTVYASVAPYVLTGAGGVIGLEGLVQWRPPKPVHVSGRALWYVFQSVASGLIMTGNVRVYYEIDDDDATLGLSI